MCSQLRLRLASLSVNSENDADTTERLRDLAFSSELTRLTEIALGVLGALRLFEQVASPVNTKLNLKEQVAEFESRLIRSALIKTGGNQRCAAQALGIKPSTLNIKIKRYGIELVGSTEEGEVEKS